MARLYTNENVALPIVLNLRQLGHDVLTAHESGRANQKIPDAEVLAFASEANRILLTNNRRDFLALYRSDAPHCGLVVFTTGNDFESVAARIDEALCERDLSSRFLARITLDGYSVDE